MGQFLSTDTEDLSVTQYFFPGSTDFRDMTWFRATRILRETTQP